MGFLMQCFKAIMPLLVVLTAISPITCQAMFEDYNPDIGHQTLFRSYNSEAKQPSFESLDPKKYELDKERLGSEPAPAYLLEKTRMALKSMSVKNAHMVPVHLLKKDYKSGTNDGLKTLGITASTGIWLSDRYCEISKDLTAYLKQLYTAKNRYTSYHEAAHFSLEHSSKSEQLCRNPLAELENERQLRNQLEQELQDCSKRWWRDRSKEEEIFQKITESYEKTHALRDQFNQMLHSLHFKDEQEADELAVAMMCKDGYAHEVSLLREMYRRDESQKDNYYISTQCAVINNAYQKWRGQHIQKQDTLRDLFFSIGR